MEGGGGEAQKSWVKPGRILTGHRWTSQYAFSWQSSAYLSALFLSFPVLKSQKPKVRPLRLCSFRSVTDPIPDDPDHSPNLANESMFAIIMTIANPHVTLTC